MPIKNSSALSRRGFLALGGGAVAAGALEATLPRLARTERTFPSTRPSGGGTARNLIFMVSDGMSMGTLTLADTVRRIREGERSHWIGLWQRPGVRRAIMATHSADSLVTDSAAGAAAWSIGRKVRNNAINVTPDNHEHMPLFIRAAEAGKATGLVTTTRVTHATPAAFIANVHHRNQEDRIARQIVSRGVDVVLGGGAVYFPDSLFADRNIHVARNRTDLAAADELPLSTRLMGLFANEHMAYALDRQETEPSLSDMTAAALRRLSKYSNGFVLHVEGGRVDHAAHANDAPSLVFDQLAFDDALAVAIDFVDSRDDTLLIITTDHGNANPGLTVYNRDADRGFEHLLEARHSFEWIMAELEQIESEGGRLAALPHIIARATSVELTDTELALVHAAQRDEPVNPFAQLNKHTSVLGSVLANHFGVAFCSPNHTSDHVEVTAVGPEADRLASVIDNTDLHDLMLHASGLTVVPSPR